MALLSAVRLPELHVAVPTLLIVRTENVLTPAPLMVKVPFAFVTPVPLKVPLVQLSDPDTFTVPVPVRAPPLNVRAGRVTAVALKKLAVPPLMLVVPLGA